MLVADPIGDRQRRRKTGEQNVARCALEDGARGRLTVAATAEVRWLPGEPDAARVKAGGSRGWNRIEWVSQNPLHQSKGTIR